MIYNHLSETCRASADGIFVILSTKTADLESLSSIRDVTLQERSVYKDINTIAAMKYMSILHSQKSERFDTRSRLEPSLIEEDTQPNNLKERPKLYWYNEGYLPDQRRRVLVEWRYYDKKLDHDITGEEFREQVEAMFHRNQGLVELLRRPKPANFRVLDCLGTFHDDKSRKFGIVYSFPNNQSTPVRLHYLLKRGGSERVHMPHIGQRLTLAKTLVACLQSLHVSGWVHKDINSNNVLFFTPARPLRDDDYRPPYLVGFQHSREDERSAYTVGPDSDDETRHYQHPCYREGLNPFKREFDYYSLGLTLLEIGVWECLRDVYIKRRTFSPSQLRDEYITICNRHILERMGPTYHEATMTCLQAAQADSKLSGKEEDVALDFQKDVIDKLESCRF